MEFTQRFCGRVGYLGLILEDGREIYRTGKHHTTPHEALTASIEWLASKG